MRLTRCLAHASLILGICCSTATAADSLQVAQAQLGGDHLLPMEVTVNGASGGTWLLLERDGALHAPAEAFEEWRLQLNNESTPVEFKRKVYWPLKAVPGYNAKVNFANQSVELTFSPQAFSATRLGNNEAAQRPVPSPVLPSVQFGYDMSYSKSYLRNASSIEDLSALTEIAASGQLGVLTNSVVGRNLMSNKTAATLGTKPEWVRLETTFTRDLPELNSTLRLGDTSTRAGMLGNGVYFGGFQFGTNFALSPGFAHQPLPTLSGTSSTPSTVQLYVNDVLRQVSIVPAGPFAIENLPTMTGGGDARIVVTDQLGRQTVIQQSFFTNNQLLRPGLDDWSVEAGRVRLDLGSASTNYGSGFVGGLWRRGIDERLTLEGRTAISAQRDLLQLGAITALPFQLLGRAALAGSRDKNLGNGTQHLLGVEHQGLRFYASYELQGATLHYRNLGETAGVMPTKQQQAGNVSYASESFGSFGFGFASIRRDDGAAITTFSANYAMHVGERSELSVTASRAQGGFSSNAIGINLTMLLDGNRIANGYFNRSGNTTDAYATYAQNAEPNDPLGWRVLAGQTQNQRHDEGGVSYLGKNGSLSGEASETPNQTALRLGANGGVIFAEGHLFATPRITNSFALAEVKDYGDVGVGIGSNVVSKTDASGVALVPNLTAYQRNSIRLDAGDLPVSAEIDSIEREVVPGWRSGVKVSFPVRSGRGALLKIQLENGESAPPGAIVKIEGDAQEFYVARRGEAFVTGLQKTANHLFLTWKGQQCRFDVTLLPQQTDEIPRVGPLSCIGGVAR